VVASKGDDAVQFGIEALDAFEIDVNEMGAFELPGLDPVREMMDRGVGDGLFGLKAGRHGFAWRG